MFSLKDKNPRILVVGDLMVDHYLWGECNRISPEAPVQVINVKKETKRLGGAGNVLHNLKDLGACVGILSAIGDDEAGDDIKKLLKDLGVEAKLQSVKGRKSSIKSRLMSSHQQIVRMDKESCEEIGAKCQNELLKDFESVIKDYDSVILSDYGKGVLSKHICQSIIKKANELNLPILVDPKGEDYSKYKNATLLTPNKKEACEATKIKIQDEASLNQAIKKLKNELNLKYSLITLSSEGIALYDDTLHIVPALSREVYDVTGAGDTVIASLSYALTCNVEIKKAISFANKAAAVVVGKIGSATATFEEIAKYEHEKSIGELEDRVVSKEKLKEILQKTDKKIIFTNGCFDILHVGHAKYLKKAKALGDILVVGLNSDSSVKRLKGASRPINGELDRACLLSALGFVDYVVIFDEDTPYELIKYLSPDVLVKGADYKDKKVVGSELVKEVHLIDFIEGKSTTNIVNKINKDNNG